MYAYCLTKVHEGQPRWFATQGEAQTAGRSSTLMKETKLLCVDIDIDKRGIVALLNRDDQYTKVLRTWEFTARGGLKELNSPEERDITKLNQEPAATPETMDRAASAVARQMAQAMATGTGAVRVTATDEGAEITEANPYGIAEPDWDDKSVPEGKDAAEFTRTRAEIDARDA